MTILEYELTRQAKAREKADFQQRMIDEASLEATARRAAELERRRVEKREADCNRFGVGVWEIDATGKVIAKYPSGPEAARTVGIRESTMNMAILHGYCVKKNRRFIRCGYPIPKFRKHCRAVRRIRDGKIFDSVMDLAKWLNAKHGSVYKSVLTGKVRDGERYEFAD